MKDKMENLDTTLLTSEFTQILQVNIKLKFMFNIWRIVYIVYNMLRLSKTVPAILRLFLLCNKIIFPKSITKFSIGIKTVQTLQYGNNFVIVQLYIHTMLKCLNQCCGSWRDLNSIGSCLLGHPDPDLDLYPQKDPCN